ncbi:hypothetical protein FALCPG4_010334 [Fusarium falciforme]
MPPNLLVHTQVSSLCKNRSATTSGAAGCSPKPTFLSLALSQEEPIPQSSHYLKEKLLNYFFTSGFFQANTMRRFQFPRARPWHPSAVSNFLLKISYFALGTVVGGKGVEDLWYTIHRASPKYYLLPVSQGSRRTPVRASMAAVASSEYKSMWAFFCELVRNVRPKALLVPLDAFHCRRGRRAVKPSPGISGADQGHLHESALIFLIFLLGIYKYI